MSGPSETTAPIVSIPSVSSASNMLSTGESGIKPVMEASKSLGYDESSISFVSQRNSILAERERNPLPYTSPRGQSQGNEFASLSHISTQNQHQQNSYNIQNVSHQSHGGRHNQEHVNQNWNPQGNFNEQGGLTPPPRGGTLVFASPSPPSIYAQHIPVQQLFYPIEFTDLPPPMIYHPHRMSFMEPSPVTFPHCIPFMEPPPFLVPSQKYTLKTKILNQVQEAPLKTKILNQVQYYLSEDNLPHDVHLRKRMNDEGFVHIEFIAGFNKLKTLTSNIQLILDSLRDSDIVEVQGYEIRNRRVWKKYVMPHDWRVTFYPSPQYAVANNHQ